jgi:hypothetical protein
MIQGNQIAGVGRVLNDVFGVEMKFNAKEWSCDFVEQKVGKGIKKK